MIESSLNREKKSFITFFSSIELMFYWKSVDSLPDFYMIDFTREGKHFQNLTKLILKVESVNVEIKMKRESFNVLLVLVLLYKVQ